MNARTAKQKEVLQLYITCLPLETSNMLKCRRIRKIFLMERLLIIFSLLLLKSMLIMSDQETEFKL